MNKQLGKTKRVRFSLRLKMNILIGASILVTSIGLLAITYTVHCTRINELLCDQTEQAACIAGKYAYPDCVEFLIDNIETDEFRSVRSKAEAENDPDAICEWMKSKRGTLTDLAQEYSLYDDYTFCVI